MPRETRTYGQHENYLIEPELNEGIIKKIAFFFLVRIALLKPMGKGFFRPRFDLIT